MRGLKLFLFFSTVYILVSSMRRHLKYHKGVDVGHPDETYIDEFGDIL